MPGFLPGALFTGLFAVVLIFLLYKRANKQRPALWKLALAGVVAAYIIPPLANLVSQSLNAMTGLPIIASGQIFLGAWAAIAALAISIRPGQPPRLSLWSIALIGVGVAVLVPALLNWSTGSYQRLSLQADVNHCMRAAPGQSKTVKITNSCQHQVTVGLCLPSEKNPSPCRQSKMLEPGETGEFDPQGSGLAALPSNPNGYTIIACQPPARPSRMVTSMGRGHEGVCLPAG